MSTFYKLLSVTLLVVTTNNLVWFALTFWAFLTTKSVLATSTIAGIFLVATALSGVWFGSIVDHHKKRNVMLGSSAATLILFSTGLVFHRVSDPSDFESVAGVRLWIFVVVLLSGTISGTIYNIAIPTLVGLVVPEDRRDRANGMFGTVIGASWAITSVASGLTLAFGGMEFVLRIAVVLTVLAIVALALISVPEHRIIRTAHESKGRIDIRGTIAVVKAIPGLFALIFFTTFNNFLRPSITRSKVES